MRLVKLHFVNGTPLYVNPESVTAVWNTGSENTLSLVGGKGNFFLKESVDEIISKLGCAVDDERVEEWPEALYELVPYEKFGSRTAKKLRDAHIYYMWQLVEATPHITIRNFSAERYRHCQKVLSNMGLSLGMNLHGFPGKTSHVDDGREWNEALFKHVHVLQMSVRSSNCMHYAGIELIWQLVEKSEKDLMGLKNFGRLCLTEVKDILDELGLSLGMDLTGFPGKK